MPASRLVIMAVALASAGGAGYLAMNWMQPPPPEVVEVPAGPAVQTTEVLALTGDVAMGQPLEGKIAWQEWPSSGVSDGFITKQDQPDALDKLKNSLARVSLYGGEPVRKAKLVGEGQSFMSSILPSGRRAVATQIAADTSAGGFILPNDFVDIIMTRRKPGEGGAQAEGAFITETILKNIKVLAIDQAIQEDEEGRRVKVGETATLELTPQQAEIITVAQQMADRLTLSLRSVTDAQEAQGEADYLIDGNGKRGTIRLIKSGEVSEVGARK
jgi:pilus assembly protein CpaB